MTQGENFLKAVRLIENSNLPQADKDFWYEEMKKLPDQYLKPFIYFLENAGEKLDWLTSLHKRKQQALDKGDKVAWQALLQEEQKALEVDNA